MPNFDHIPMLKILVFYAAGIAIADHFHPVFSFSLAHIAVAMLMACGGAFLSLRMRSRALFSVFAALFLMLAGIFMHRNFDERTNSSHFLSYYDHQSDHLIVKIASSGKTTMGARLICRVEECIKGDKSISVSGNLLVYTDSLPPSGQFHYGDILVLSSPVMEIPKERNPLAFNPSAYYHYQNIHYQSYTRREGFTIVQTEQKFMIRRAFEQLNRNIKQSLSEIIPGNDNANIAISIILGDRQGLDREILATFANTGIRHILTVSGMHVGIVALILNFLFSFVKSNSRIWRIMKIVLILGGVWFYAFLTGLQPAIMRASFMISAIMIGINIGRNTSSLNVLFASATVLLIYNPLQIYQLSFILSYTAMLSILVFYTPIYRLVNARKYKLFHYIWQLTSLSLAAQVLMYPLSLYYFHNGPSLFFITTLIATPMAFAVLSLGFVSVIAGVLIADLGFFAGKILGVIIEYSLVFINHIDSFSINTGEYFYIGKADIILIFLIVMSIALYFMHNIRFSYIMFLVFMSSLILSQFSRVKTAKTEDELVVFHSRMNLVADFYINGDCYNISKTPLSVLEYTFTNRSYRFYRSVDKVETLEDKLHNGYFWWENNIFKTADRTVVILDKNPENLQAKAEKIDVLVLGDVGGYRLKRFIEDSDISQVVFSTAMNYRSRNYLKRNLPDWQEKIWDVNEQGAFIYKLN
jgi:competence protein ComEC